MITNAKSSENDKGSVVDLRIARIRMRNILGLSSSVVSHSYTLNLASIVIFVIICEAVKCLISVACVVLKIGESVVILSSFRSLKSAVMLLKRAVHSTTLYRHNY